MKAGEIIKFNSGLIALAVTLKTDDSDIVNFGNIDSRIGAKGIVRSIEEIGLNSLKINSIQNEILSIISTDCRNLS